MGTTLSTRTDSTSAVNTHLKTSRAGSSDRLSERTRSQPQIPKTMTRKIMPFRYGFTPLIQFNDARRFALLLQYSLLALFQALKRITHSRRSRGDETPFPSVHDLAADNAEDIHECFHPRISRIDANFKGKRANPHPALSRPTGEGEEKRGLGRNLDLRSLCYLLSKVSGSLKREVKSEKDEVQVHSLHLDARHSTICYRGRSSRGRRSPRRSLPSPGPCAWSPPRSPALSPRPLCSCWSADSAGWPSLGTCSPVPPISLSRSAIAALRDKRTRPFSSTPRHLTQISSPRLTLSSLCLTRKLASSL